MRLRFALPLPHKLLPLQLALLLLCACGPKASSVRGNTEGYNLDHPATIILPSVLNEISGIWSYPKDGSLFAIEDEDGFLYKINPKKPDQILRWRFHGHGDFEDVCLVGETFFILRSDGAIFACNIPSGSAVKSTKYEFPEEGNEFESLYYDDSLRRLVMVCKECSQDSKKQVSIRTFDPATGQFATAPFKLDAQHIASIIGEEKIRFKPSAATINPFTGQIWLISSVNKLLVVATRSGEVLQAYPLDPGIYKQPEGIAFGADRTLYISNEGAEIGSGNILVMPYRPARTQ